MCGLNIVMKLDRFVTTTFAGHFDIDPKIIKEYKEWAEFEKTLDPDGAKESTTQNGWQYVFGQHAVTPAWYNKLGPVLNEIKNEIGCVRVKTIWAIDYEPGGYQDPHIHNSGLAKVMSFILNLDGEGEVILQDPRQIAVAQGLGFADIIKLTPGDWLAFPGYIVHNSRPAKMSRSILVMDVYV